MLIDETNYVDKAEEAIKLLANKKDPKNNKPVAVVTTSKLRNLLGMVSDVYNDVLNVKEEKLGRDIIERINYMRLRFYYEAGREPSVKNLLETAKVFEVLKDVGSSRKNYILFSQYMEALVAFRKYYVEKDD